ncbi:hypothetical protein [Streptomyces sp. NPDC057910]|uniref:hypothetical protein n=1 Tax=Streptomyces sp. NPDC057910 TaxID=3346278 RepID=UPI0036EC8622
MAIRLTLLCHGPLPPALAAALAVLPLGTARARINQALHEFALAGRRAGLSYARMSAFTGIPEDDLVKQVEDYHRLMTT